MKKIIIILVALISFFSATISSNAATNYIYIGDTIEGVRVQLHTDTMNFSMGMEQLVNRSTGELVYCIEPGIHLYDGDYTKTTFISKISEMLSIEEWDYLKILTFYGYGYENRTDLRWYVATQFMVWDYMLRDKGEIYFINNAGEKINPYDTEIKAILKDVENHNIIPSFTNKVSSDSYLKIRTGKEITLIDENNVLSKFDVECNDVNATLKTEGNKLTFKSNSTAVVSLYFYHHDDSRRDGALFYKPSSQTVISRNSFFAPVFLNAEMTTPTIKIIKNSTEDVGLPTSGAKYNIYRSNNTLYKSITIGSDGTYTLLNIPAGEYYLIETEAPYGYQLNTEKIRFTVTTEDLNIEVSDKPIKKEIIIEKYLDNVDGSLELESSAIFKLYKKETNKLISAINTDKYGKIKLSLPYGTYILKQTSGSEGYQFISDYEFKVNAKNDSSTRIILKNKAIYGSLEINKLDQNNNLILDSASFKIRNINTDKYLLIKGKEIIKTKDGKITLDKIPFGEYELEEVDAPTGYLKGDNIKFSIKGQDEAISLNVFNNKITGSVEINKLDKDTKNLILDKAIFKIKNIKTKEYLKWNNSELLETIEGKIRIDNLEYGDYELEEIISPIGYLKEKTIKFKIRNDQEVIHLDVYNNKITGNLEIIKKCENTNDLIMDETIFKIKDLNKNEYLSFNGSDELKTIKGKINIKGIPYGNYLLEEISPPRGYLTKEPTFFSINEEGEAVSIEVFNKRIEGALEIHKVDKDTKELIIDEVTFKIKDIETNKYLIFNGSEEINTKDGIIKLESIPYGKYELEEVSTPSNYIKENNVYFEITENEKIVLIEVENKKRTGTLTIKKLDSNTLKPLESVVFAIFKEDGTLMGEYKTNEEGVINLSNLEIGKYLIKEIVTLDSYELNDEEIEVEIKEGIKSIVSITNRFIIEAPPTGVNEFLISFLISTIMILIGSILCHEKKNR